MDEKREPLRNVYLICVQIQYTRTESGYFLHLTHFESRVALMETMLNPDHFCLYLKYLRNLPKHYCIFTILTLRVGVYIACFISTFFN